MTLPEPIAELVETGKPAEVKVDPAIPTDPAPKEPAAPSEPAADTPADPANPNPDEVLYELPDGRKVTADVLQTEWKTNFLPEFTRKSQRLAEYEKGTPPAPKEDIKSNLDNKPKWQDPNYIPSSYGELIEIAKEEVRNESTKEREAEQARITAVTNEVETQLNDVKKLDPKVDENALFQHANKYGFSDLRAAFTNMKDMKAVIVSTEQKTVKNLQKRESDPVSSAAGGSAPGEDGYDPREMSQFSSAVEFLARIKSK